MIVSINQPAYLPWLGYFHRIAVSDLHVVFDHVQFEKNSFTNRNKIRTKEGWCWLTVPLKTKGKFGELAIKDIEIANDLNWREKHWQTLRLNYGKARYAAEHLPFFEGIYARPWAQLNDLLRETTRYLIEKLGIRTPIVYSSEMKVEGRKSDLVLNICRQVGATTYLSGALGKGYLDEPSFAQEGIKVCYQDYKHPEYSQVYPGFQPNMAVLDLLFNHGPDSLNIIRSSQEMITI